MREIFLLITRIFDVLFAPLAKQPPVYSLLAVCVPTGALLMTIYALVSNQEAMRQTKERIKLHFMEISIYRDDLTAGTRALKEIFWQNLRYISLTLKPASFMMLLVILLLGQLNLRFSHQPLQPEESFILSIRLVPGADLGKTPRFDLSLPTGLEIETPSLYMPDVHKVDWRLHAKEYGIYNLEILVAGHKVTKQVVVSKQLVSFSGDLGKNTLLNVFTNPIESPLVDDLPIESINIGYQQASYLQNTLGFQVHWLVFFFVFTMMVGLLIKKLFHIR